MSPFSIRTRHGQYSLTFTAAQLDSGSQSLPEAWDFHLANSPEHTLFVYDDGTGELTRICWAQAVRAFHRAARLVQIYVSRSQEINPVVGILASADAFTYLAITAGIVRAGYQPFLISTRNSTIAIAHLLTSMSCTHIFISSDAAMVHLSQSVVTKLAEDPDYPTVDVHMMPTFEGLYVDNEDTELLPPMVRPDMDTTMLIMHSSGSTSFPKPIVLTHRMMLQWAMIPYYGEIDFCKHIFSAHSLPMFHGFGTIQLCWATSTGLVISHFSPRLPLAIPTSESVLAGALATKSTVLLCVPAFLEIWAGDESAVTALRSFHAIIYGSAPLPDHVGDLLASRGVPLMASYGITEIGYCSECYPRAPFKEGWRWFRLSAHLNAEFIPRADDGGLCELVFFDSDTNTPTVFNTTVDGRPAYASNDLLVRHPTNPTLWRIYGRADDQIIHSTGEKTNPGPIEAILTQDPRITAAIMFGREQFQTGVILALDPRCAFDPADTARLATFRNDIWPAVERANRFAPQHSRLFKEMIMVAHAHKPFEFTAKGNPRRQRILAAYEPEIRAAYAAVAESSQAGPAPPIYWTEAEIRRFVRVVVNTVLQRSVTDDVDIFQNGCDSLQATWIRNTLLHALRQTSALDVRTISNNFVYANTSVTALSKFIARCIASGSGTPCKSATEKLREMDDLIAEYAASFSQRRLPPIHGSVRLSAGETILLTGSTGNFGSYVLGELLALPEVERVYALNRVSQAGLSLRERQWAAFKDRGVDTRLLESDKLVLLEGDTSFAGLGLDEDVYEEIRKSVTSIMHNAWRVDFNLPLSSFQPHLQGVRNLVDLALSSPLAILPRIQFTSSIAVFRNWDDNEVVPEKHFTDGRIAVGGGYGESKWVAERILQIASERTPVRPIVVRLGQLAGSSQNGAWSTWEWFPALVKASTMVGCLPNGHSPVSWIPADIAARAFVEMRCAKKPVLHLVHPRPVAWSAVASPLAMHIGVPLVSYDTWLAVMEQDMVKPGRSEADAVTENPALRILDFFRGSRLDEEVVREAMGYPRLGTQEAILVSPSLSNAGIKQLGEGDIARWLSYWESHGFIEQPKVARPRFNN